MQVRSLSPTSFWIEKPLLPQTLRLIWRAMVEYGLHSGKISSSSSGYLALPPAQQPHIVEGRTHTGFLALNALVQAQLESDGTGTRVQVEAMNAKGDFDFGAAARFKVRFTTYLADFLRVVSAERDEPEPMSIPPLGEPTPPIASPTHTSSSTLPNYGSPREIEFGPVAPLKTGLSSVSQLIFLGGLYLSTREGVVGPFFLLCLSWELWKWRQGRKPLWWGIVLLAVVGFVETGRLIQRWF